MTSPAAPDVVPGALDAAAPVGTPELTDPPQGAPDLRGRAKRGVVFSALSRVGVQAIQFATSIALTRMLAPETFGLVALVTVVTGFAVLFVDLGLSGAIVQRAELDERLLATAFWGNFALGWALAAVVSALGFPLALLFDQPDLRWLIPVASLGFALSLAVVQRGILQRSMQFAKLGALDLLSAFTYAAVAIGGAALGFGPLSLVLATVAAAVAGTVAAVVMVPWRPKARPSRAAARDLWSYSGGVLGFNTVNYWARNADNLLVGRFLGVEALGFYGRAYNLVVQPVNQVTLVLTNVMFPALAAIRGDRARFRRGWTTSCKVSVMVGAPLGIGIAVAAPAFVETLYGARWLPMAGPLALLAAAVPLSLLGSATGPLFQSLGRTGQQFRIGLVTTAVTLIAIGVSLPFGITAVAGALLLKSLVTVWIPLRAALRAAGMSVGPLLWSMRWVYLATAVMAAAALGVRAALTGSSAPLVLLAQVAVAVVVYVGVLAATERTFIRELRGGRS